MRLVFDTCVLVAAIRSRKGAASSQLVDYVLTGDLEIVLTVPLYCEYQDVLCREEHCLGGWTMVDSQVLIDKLLAQAKTVAPTFSYRPLTEDPADEFVLEAAIMAQADIVTFNERHFTAASRFGVRVFKPIDVIRKLMEG